MMKAKSVLMAIVSRAIVSRAIVSRAIVRSTVYSMKAKSSVSWWTEKPVERSVSADWRSPCA